MRENTAKTKLLAGRPAIGVIANLGSPLAAGSLSQAGYDFVAVDTQHGAWSVEESFHAFHEIALGRAIPMARVQENNFYAIGRLLDRGAMGIIVPMVNCRRDAEAAAFAMRYPPRGGRSVGAFAVEHYGSDYGEVINEQLFLAVQIETAEAVENAEGILSVPGVDGCWIGPGDLSGSLGTDLSTGPGRQRHEDAIMRVLDVCHRTGKAPGIAAGYDVERWLGKGFLFVTGLSDLGFVRDGARDLLERYRSLLASEG